jgi:hypothetical protein
MRAGGGEEELRDWGSLHVIPITKKLFTKGVSQFLSARFTELEASCHLIVKGCSFIRTQEPVELGIRNWIADTVERLEAVVET